MDRRIIDFIASMRQAGVRISVAESADALRAIEYAGIRDKNFFRSALQATLIKEPQDVEIFNRFFPLYFSSNEPPPMQPSGGGQLSDEEQRQLDEMLAQMLANMSPEQLARLFESMMNGQPMSNQEMRDLLNQLSPPIMSNPMYQQWMTRRAMREMRFHKLEQALRELLEQLRAQGMSEEALQAIEQAARENQQALADQIADQVGQHMIEQGADEGKTDNPQPIEQLLDRPFEYLDPEESRDLRAVVNRLAARLRSRLALRQRRGKTGTLDAKSTIRHNMRFGAVPIQIHHRRRHLKPKLVILCDRSRSTENVMTFLLLMIYALHDQVSRTRSFAFIDHIHDISLYFNENRPEQAVQQVMQNIYPVRSYSTDLGTSLGEFVQDYCGCVDQRTTVIVLGDGRNNENDPGLEYFEQIRRRARKVVWFNPESPHMWGKYDPGSLSSDMLKYMPMCDAVHHVSNMRQLAAAVDALFTR